MQKRIGLALTLSMLVIIPIAATHADELIQACVRPTGALRLIGDDFRRQSCRQHEMLVDWPAANGVAEQVADLEGRMEAVEEQTADLGGRTTTLEGQVTALEDRQLRCGLVSINQSGFFGGGNIVEVAVSCPAERLVTGGGCQCFSTDADPRPMCDRFDDRPAANLTGWICRVTATGSFTDITTYAVCCDGVAD